ncbi:MAG: hypothetical protein WC661_16795 [Opitutaceae bacterium]|jgi:hypothetical protein
MHRSKSRATVTPHRRLFLSKSAHQIDDEHDQHNQAEAPATNGRAANIEAAATEEKQQHDDQQNNVHPDSLADLSEKEYGALPYLSLVRAEATGAGETGFTHGKMKAKHPASPRINEDLTAGCLKSAAVIFIAI